MASTPAKAVPKSARIRYYKEYLSPTLHRRCAGAAGVLLVVSYLEAIVFRHGSPWLWLFFPLGPAGICTLLLFISSLAILLLRIAHLHFGERISKSPAHAVAKSILDPEIVVTYALYFLSAWWFSEIYVWSGPPDLYWVVEGRSYERPQLNERPIYLRCHFLVLAFVEATLHLVLDYDRCRLSLPPAADHDRLHSREPVPLESIRAAVPSIAWSSAILAGSLSVSNVFIYTLFLRSSAWNWSVSFARVFWSVSRVTDPPDKLPFFWTVLGRSLIAGTMLTFLWRMTRFAFDAYVAQTPVKRGRPLTDDSKDPNGSLLTGFKSRREIVREFAFWEIYHISVANEGRRRSIYREIDREGGSTWSQVLKASLNVVDQIQLRIADIDGSTTSEKAAVSSTVLSLPALSHPLNNGNILRGSPKARSTTEAVENAFGTYAKSIGDSTGSRPLQVLFAYAQDALLSKEAKEALDMDNLLKTFKSICASALNLDLAVVFRQTFSRKAKTVIFGSPRSDLRPILLSICSITHLALSAVDEDPYGIVNKDIALILRTFVSAKNRIESFVQDLPAHWTDTRTGKPDSMARKDRDIDLLLDHLSAALRAILRGYERYAKDMGLGPTEIREARAAAGLR